MKNHNKKNIINIKNYTTNKNIFFDKTEDRLRTINELKGKDYFKHCYKDDGDINIILNKTVKIEKIRKELT